MHAPLDRGDPVGERPDALVVGRIPLQGDLDLLVLFYLGEVGDLAEHRLLRPVEVPDEVLDPSGVAVGDRLLVAGAFVLEADLEPSLEERHHLQALQDRLCAELDLVEDRRIRPERHRRPGPVAGRRAGHQQRAGGFAAVDERHLVAVAAAVDLQLEPGREGVHDGNPDAVEST